MSETPQTYETHRRIHFPYHRFLIPILLINLLWSLAHFFQAPGWGRGEWAVLSFALAVMAYLVRIYPLRVQDRVIRLEEQFRYQRLLPADLLARSGSVTVPQMIALRFASDGELADLVRQVLDGKLVTPGDIKRAVTTWRADTLRV